ncbi:hypothetical protein LIER_05631 [Lithospermum erythrorhizon]|uniref:GBF-interacting protein 1 N-terminal domain-containing protein n=1 Tax=Lithospermum erythrorhizon TaxID=34254 RepID=A0AAV3P315_LITER
MVGGNGGELGLKEIPSGSRKVVMSLKEIVNCPEAEIYATLQDCNMDPNEAVNKLLSQDSFREVKSKREKKKENKDTAEGRPRGSVGTSSRGGRSGTGRYGRGGSTQFSSSDPAVSYGKLAYKNNGSTSHPASLSSVPGTTGNTYERSPTISDSGLTSNKASEANTGDGSLPVAQPSSGYQPGWMATPGKMSMADIVKMGKPQNRDSGAPNTSHHHGQRTSNSSSDVNLSHLVSTSLDVSVEEEWPSVEPTSAPDVSPILEPPSDSKPHDDAPGFQYNDNGKHDHDIPTVDHDAVENIAINHVESASVSGGTLQEENDDGTSLFDNDMYQNRQLYQPHNIDYHEVQEPGVSVSSMTAEMQHVNIQDDDRGSLPEDSGPSVVIPDHLQVQTGDFSHLSFGSFKVGPLYSAPLTSIPVKTNIGEEETSEADATAVGQLETRNSEYCEEGSYLDVGDGNLYNRAGASTSNYDSPSASQQEPVKHENPEVEHVNQYASTSSSPDYTFGNTHQPNVTSRQTYSVPQMQNNATFSNAMLQGYSNSLPSTLLAENVHSGREIDFPYSRFLMPSKYANGASLPSGSALSMPEALNTIGYSSAQPTQQSLSGTNGAPGLSVPQHLAMHPYSQATTPLDPNMIGYPFMPPSYSYLPSAYQQAFHGNNYNHQSLAATALLSHKMSVPASNLPQSGSGYSGFGSSTALPGNFAMNQTAAVAPPGTTIGYDDVLSSQYKDSNHLMSLQQSENSAMWLQGPGSRTMSAVPANTYYGMQLQNQQAVGLRQAQQSSQNYGAFGYPNFYHAQSGMSMDHQQQQNPRDGSLGGSQGQQKQSQQFWQNGY